MRLQVGDIDAVRARVHIRDAKGNRDRLVPLPQATHQLLRRFWLVQCNPVLLFPSRQGGMASSRQATTHMDPGGVQTALHKVVEACGPRKKVLLISILSCKKRVRENPQLSRFGCGISSATHPRMPNENVAADSSDKTEQFYRLLPALNVH